MLFPPLPAPPFIPALQLVTRTRYTVAMLTRTTLGVAEQGWRPGQKLGVVMAVVVVTAEEAAR